jgi:hypothetical protein
MQLYRIATASDVDSFSTHSDGNKGQLQKKGEDNCSGKNVDIDYKPTSVFESKPHRELHL